MARDPVYYAVIDTNVLVSALLKPFSVPGRVIELALSGRIIPIVGDEIEDEYAEVLSRRKFNFDAHLVNRVLASLHAAAMSKPSSESGDELADVPDPKDIVFYAVTLSARQEWDARLVTGNTKHFPSRPFVVTPRQMLEIVEGND